MRILIKFNNNNTKSVIVYDPPVLPNNDECISLHLNTGLIVARVTHIFNNYYPSDMDLEDITVYVDASVGNVDLIPDNCWLGPKPVIRP